MPGCNDFNCPKCGAKISWFGEVKDAPPCRRCGERIPAEELEYLQFVIDVTTATPDVEVASFEEWKRAAHGARGKEYSPFPFEPQDDEYCQSEERDDYDDDHELFDALGQEMPGVQYPGGDYDHDGLETE